VVRTAVTQKNILVPIDPENKDLKALYHALALAERIQAKIFVVFSRLSGVSHPVDSWEEEVLMDIIHGACEEGLQVSSHIAEEGLENEVISLVESEHIDLIVVSAENGSLKNMLQRIVPQMSTQIIQVKGKDHTD
jgi:predicted LPLAT superfamily acyltransferase